MCCGQLSTNHNDAPEEHHAREPYRRAQPSKKNIAGRLKFAKSDGGAIQGVSGDLTYLKQSVWQEEHTQADEILFVRQTKVLF